MPHLQERRSNTACGPVRGPRFLRPGLGLGLLIGLGLLCAPRAEAAVQRLVKQVPTPERRRPAPEARRDATRVPVTAPALLARSRPATGKQRLPAILMEHLNSHATFQLRPDLRGGGFSARQMRALSDFLRCHHTRKRRAMDPRLISLVYATARHHANAKVWVVAGYRAPQVAKQKGNPKSPHKQGAACDFRLEGVELTSLRDYLRRAYDHVGVGYYPNSGFVHLDVGRQRSAFWIDYSGPGERARYTPERDDRDEDDAGLPAPPAPPEDAPPRSAQRQTPPARGS